ncbi:MAG: hypothetical protein R2819_05540 [Allomuricauda sp.]
MRSRFFLLCICLASTSFLGAQTTYGKGRVHDSILVSGTNNETFALYLPKSYSEQRLSPIVFIYEPLGRGAVGLQPFIAASEKYGLMLVCSNDSRNGPYERNFVIANNLFAHVFSHFNIKDDEIYAAGFSGGSRLASAIASLTNRFTGVIGCGAGFSGLQEHMPSAQNYAYVGLCGNSDMNYREMLADKDFLSLIKFNSTLFTFAGDHNWPPQEEISRAFDWLYLQKIKKKNPVPLDTVLEYHQADCSLLQQFKKSGDLLFVAEQYERILKNYERFVPIDSLRAEYLSFKKSLAYKKKAAALEKALKVEEKFADKFRARFTEEFEKMGKADFLWWETELGKLKSLRNTDDVEMQKMVTRVEYDLFVRAFVLKNMLLQTQNTERVALLGRLLQIIHPKK